MINGYTLDLEHTTWANGPVLDTTDPYEVRVHNIAPDVWVPTQAYVLRQYGEFVKVITRTLMETYALLALEGIHIHTNLSQGYPMDRLSPERYGWQSWVDYAASLDAQQPELLPTP